MQEITANVSWTAIIVGFIAAYAVGFLWYGVIFQKAWALGNGLPEKLRTSAQQAVQSCGRDGLGDQ